MINPSSILTALVLISRSVLLHPETGTAQRLFSGDWYSADSSRVFRIIEVSKGNYEVRLLQSKRPSDSSGALVISALKYQRNRRKMKGVIHSLNSPLSTEVSLSANSDEDKLDLRLRRLYIFPVHLYWVRRL